MPERVHTVFKDDEDAEPTRVSLADYAQELHKQSKVSSQVAKDASVLQYPQPAPSNGVKRSRSGSPKPTPILKSVKYVTPPEVGIGDKQGAGENGQNGEKPRQSGGVSGRAETADKFKDKDSYAVEPKTFYSSPQVSLNGSKSKGLADLGGAASKDAPENGLSSQFSPRRNIISRVTNGGTARPVRKPSAVSNETARPRPSQETLQRTSQELLGVRKALPIWAHKSDIRWALRHSDVLLLVGETGSGKSTQVPQFLTSEPWFKRQLVKIKDDDGNERQVPVGGMVAITEPRRVAAISLAYRVAQETGSFLGRGQGYDDDQVGYSVRFDTIMPRKARIKFLTEGMLLQELLRDPHLRHYSVIVIDEIHERSVDVDLLSGFLRNLVLGDKTGRGGVPLKIVVMSATANMEGLQKFFGRDASVAESLLSPAPPDRSGLTNGAHQATSNENGRTSEPQVGESSQNSNGSKGKSVIRSDDPADRRVSDASYSSWDGIESDEEPVGPSEQNSKSSSESHSNGFSASVSSPAADLNGNGTMDGNSRAKTSASDSTGVTIHHIKGRQHPVKIFYTPEPVPDYIEATLHTIFKIHTREPLPGDILAFLTGQEEIETLKDLVEHHAEMLNKQLPKVKVLCLFGHQTNEQQQEAFAVAKDKKTRKVVLATNLAETSITVPGVRFVIDCGKAKIKQHRVRLGLQSLLIKSISKSSAIQRKGRAGREAPGKCYRLYTEAEYLKLPDADIPEILRSDIVEAVLRMKARGVQDIFSFPLLDPPDVDAMERALRNLHTIGALNDNGELNEVGTRMAEFPLPAAYGRVLVAAADPTTDCILEAIDIIACLTAGDDIFLQPKSEEKREEIEDTRRDLLRREGDIITYLTAMQKYASEHSNRSEWCEKRLISTRDMKYAMSVRRQLRDLSLKWKMIQEKPTPDPQPFVPISVERAEVLLKCFMKAFAIKTATLQPDGSYCTTEGKNLVAIHPSSVLHGKKLEAIMFLEHVYTQKNYAKKVSAIQMNWIADVLEMD